MIDALRSEWVKLRTVPSNMVVIVIAFPSTVTWLLDKPISAEDISKVRIEVPQMDDLPPLDFGPPSKQ